MSYTCEELRVYVSQLGGSRKAFTNATAVSFSNLEIPTYFPFQYIDMVHEMHDPNYHLVATSSKHAVIIPSLEMVSLTLNPKHLQPKG